MKRLILAFLISLLVACATVSQNSQLKFAYDTVSAYTDSTATALMRGRITPDQASKASANAKKARDAVDTAAIALAKCVSPCDPSTILNGLQPTLIELEKELRAREGAKP
jgi:hypothetical protein